LFVVWVRGLSTRAFAESRDAAICPISGHAKIYSLELGHVGCKLKKYLLCRVQVSIHHGSMYVSIARPRIKYEPVDPVLRKYHFLPPTRTPVIVCSKDILLILGQCPFPFPSLPFPIGYSESMPFIPKSRRKLTFQVESTRHWTSRSWASAQHLGRSDLSYGRFQSGNRGGLMWVWRLDHRRCCLQNATRSRASSAWGPQDRRLRNLRLLLVEVC
jgi:hypothetical protein